MRLTNLTEGRGWKNDPNRCTLVTVNALCDHFGKERPDQTRAPMHGVGVLELLKKAGLKLGTMVNIYEPERETVKSWVARHPKGAFYMGTAGHAMAVIDGKLIDATGRGPDRRIVAFVMEVYEHEREHAPPKIVINADPIYESRQTYFGGFTNPPERAVVIKYMSGWCPYFALAVHDLYGGTLLTTGDHYAVRIGDRYVDARGVMSHDTFMRDLRREPEETDREWLKVDLDSGMYECGFFEESELAKAKRLVNKIGIRLPVKEAVQPSPEARALKTRWNQHILIGSVGGQDVAWFRVERNPEAGTACVHASVDASVRRKGISSLIYDIIEMKLEQEGLKLVPYHLLSDEAYAFWQKRDPEALKNHRRSGAKWSSR